ncbi:DUF2808 domain-containing protein [Synechococcus sp. A10-1-5-1]|jgi:hypothetical protein|uniref:DUF2808 domain-containing protein n=1 Tax=Synechococcus sp. A10-1-5-1 TaxID=2936507 RepID=UPI002001C2FA|nr:DUF2808 domain-containing protein [Synechococcus sp. A10-1-5-1]UPM50797.1 DUF2808 domain-containing protein [Synechococcus sp. A10-1-5-1]
MDKIRLLESMVKRSAFGIVSALSLVASPVFVAPSQAEGSSSAGFEFRWDNNSDFRKLYYYTSSARSTARADYYLILGPKDRKTALIKLAVSVPESFNAQIKPENVELCRMERGGALKKTRCLEVIPAAVEVTGNGTAVEVFPQRPVPIGGSIGLHLQIFNPDSGMYQFNALGQAPGDVPVSGYLGSWVIEVSADD